MIELWKLMAVFPEMSLGGRMVFSQEERGQVYSRQREQQKQRLWGRSMLSILKEQQQKKASVFRGESQEEHQRGKYSFADLVKTLDFTVWDGKSLEDFE